jgi:hypothetical protein
MTAAEFRGRSQPARPGARALGRLPIGTKNKTEQRYEDEVLAPALRGGEVLWYKFEGVKLRLADNTFYTADFFVMRADRVLEVHEVKGFWTDDARVKIKVAAALFPFDFIAASLLPRKSGGGWKEERF